MLALRGLADGEAFDLDHFDRRDLRAWQMGEQALKADPGADAGLVGFACKTFVELGLVGAVDLAQMIDPAIARDRGQPWQERPRRIVTGALAVQRQERVLHQIVKLPRPDPPGIVAPQPTLAGLEQSSIGRAVAGLRHGHQPGERGIVSDHRCMPRAEAGAAMTGRLGMKCLRTGMSGLFAR